VSKSKIAGDLQELGGNIRRIRTSLEMTQERLAELADINARSVRRIEAGEMNVRITTVARIRNALTRGALSTSSAKKPISYHCFVISLVDVRTAANWVI